MQCLSNSEFQFGKKFKINLQLWKTPRCGGATQNLMITRFWSNLFGLVMVMNLLAKLSPDDKFESIRLDRRVQLNILGVLTWVATPEDVVLSKLRWRLESRSETQWRDCIEIAASQNLDTDYMRLWAHQIGITSDLEELLAATQN